jgi:uncharacterized protein YndB with AHSA1/START domain
MKPDPIVIERTYEAPVEKVWKALTDKNDMRQWYFDLKTFKPEVGFEFVFDAGHEGKAFRHICKITEVILNRKISYTWRYDGHPGNSVVTFELFPDGNKRTRIKLTHQGFETFPPVPDFARKNFVEGWTDIIGTQLKGFVEKPL